MAKTLHELSLELDRAANSLQLFLAVYGYLSETGEWQAAFVNRHELYDREAQRLIAEWRNDAISSISKPPSARITGYFKSVITNSLAHDRGARAIKLVAGLRAIEAAFARAHLHAGDAKGPHSPFVEMRTRLRKNKPYDAWNGRAIYPKPRAALGLRGQHLDDYLDFFCVIDVAQDRGHIPVRYISREPPQPIHGDQLHRIGLVPVVLSADQVEWELVDHERYRVRLHPAELRGIIARVIDGLDWLMARTPQVVLLPELVDHPELQGSIKAYFKARAENDLYVPHLILCGSMLAEGDGGDNNRAHVLAGDGGDLWQQNKMHAYRFSAAEQEAVGFPFKEATCIDRFEDISIAPREIVICDLSASLRCAVFICEDFQQDESIRSLNGWDVSLLLVPVMNAPINSNGWVYRRALQLAARPGAMSAVVNSATLVSPLAADSPAEALAAQLGCIIGSPRVKVAWESYVPAGFAQPSALLASLTPYEMT